MRMSNASVHGCSRGPAVAGRVSALFAVAIFSFSSVAQDMPNNYSGECVFAYDEQPGITVTSEGVRVMKSTLVVAASKRLMASGDMEINFPPCDATDGACAFLASAPLYLPANWTPGTGEWVRGGYRFVADRRIRVESVWSKDLFPVVVFHDSADKPANVPLAIYYVDAEMNLVGFDADLASSERIGSNAMSWRTSNYWLKGEAAPLSCFSRSN